MMKSLASTESCTVASAAATSSSAAVTKKKSGRVIGFSFFAFGDFGYDTPEAKRAAAAMHNIFLKQQQQQQGCCCNQPKLLPPRLVLALGDNFYPSGIFSVNDEQVQRSFVNVFLEGEYKKTLATIPFRAVLGNHCYMGNWRAQRDLSFSEPNPLLPVLDGGLNSTNDKNNNDCDDDEGPFVKCARRKEDPAPTCHKKPTDEEERRDASAEKSANHQDKELVDKPHHVAENPVRARRPNLTIALPSSIASTSSSAPTSSMRDYLARIATGPARVWQMYGDPGAENYPTTTDNNINDKNNNGCCYKFSVPLFPSRFYPAAKNTNNNNNANLPDDDVQTSTTSSPSTCTATSSSTSSLDPSIHAVDFFAFDTNAAQFSVRKDAPHVVEDYPKNLAWLVRALAESKALYKVFFAHHPLYTKGTNHGTVADCLRGAEYYDRRGRGPHPGMGLEKVLMDGKVDFYFAGHEHVLQAFRGPGDIQHIGSGSVLEGGFYGGEALDRHMDFVSKTLGFVHATVSVENYFCCRDDNNNDDAAPSSSTTTTDGNREHAEVKFRVDFVESKAGDVIHSVEKCKPLFSAKS